MKLVHSLVIWAYMVSLVLAHYFAIGTNSGKQQRNQTVDKPDADDIIIKLKPGGTFEDVVEICDKHPKFTIGRQFELLGDTYVELVIDKVNIPRDLVSGDVSLTEDDEDVCAIRKNEKVDSVQIDYKQTVEVMVSDQELDYAWYLTKQPRMASMNIDKAWKMGYTGKGVTITVVDTQTQVNHTDLTNIDAKNSMNVFDNPRTNQELLDDGIWHGTAVSGIIGATRGNDFCTTGVAYNTTLLAVGLLSENSVVLTVAEIVEALTHNLTSVDISSNSWGASTSYGFQSPNAIIESAIEHGATVGRQGKGIIYVIAAGNGGPQSNTAINPLLTNIYTIPISSVEYDTVVSYGQIGSNIFAVGYGGSSKDKLIRSLFPVDICSISTGLAGIAGTSFSAPQVSGIIALAFEANNDLTWRDVQHLLVRSSKRHKFKDNYYPGYKWRKNGVGFFFHPKMGFGLVDALQMVKTAKSWKTVPEMLSCTLSAINITGIAENRKYLIGYLPVSRRDCSIRFIENVRVTVDVTYSAFRGFTEIDIVSPRRTRSPLLAERVGDNSNYLPGSFQWTFRTVHFWGESTRGKWKLMTRSLSNYGTVGPVSWSVTFYGTAEHPRSKS